MNEKIMLIGKQLENFMLNAIMDTLKKEGYSVDYIQPNIDLICDPKNKPNAIVIYAGKYIYECMDVMNFVGNFCLNNNLKVFIVGYANEIEKLKKVLPDIVIQATFERPFNTKSLIDTINNSFEIGMQVEKKYILVVDDSGTMLRTIRSWLTPEYKVAMASSASMALTFLAEKKPDLILLDYAMPICSGPQFLSMIREREDTKDIPVIFLTSKGDRESVTKVLEYKPAGYLLKTMSPDIIIGKINQFFDSQKQN